MSDCDVCIGTDLDETYSEYSTNVKAARRDHACCECKSRIPKGQLHQHAIGRMEYWGDGDKQSEWDVYHTCLLCSEIRTVFSCGEGCIYGTLWDDMREYAFERLTTASPCFLELSSEAKAVVLDRWRKWKGLAA